MLALGRTAVDLLLTRWIWVWRKRDGSTERKDEDGNNKEIKRVCGQGARCEVRSDDVGVIGILWVTYHALP